MKTKQKGVGKVLSSRQLGEDRERLGLYAEQIPDRCNSPHPTERVRVRGVVRFVTCQLRPFHKLDHAACGLQWRVQPED